MFRNHVLVCGGTGCTSGGSLKIIEEFKKRITENELDKEVQVITSSCLGICTSL